MRINMKREKSLFSGLFIVLVLCFGVLYGGNHITANAAMTQNQIKKKIVTLNKEIKNLQKKKAAEEKKEKKQAKGTESIVGEIISISPYIIYQDLVFSESYYWVENSKYMNAYMGFGTGYVKLTGKYRDYNGTTCTVCKAVKVGTKSLKYQNTIEKKKKELKNCKNSLKEKVTLSNTKIKVNQKKKMKYKWKYSGKYNTIKWKSSDTDIATIDSKGNITGHKQGEVTITATCSVSGNKSECTVCIYDDFRVYADIDDEYVEICDGDLINISEKQVQITCEFLNSNTKDTITYECDGDTASITQDGLLSFEYSGGYAAIKISSLYKSIEFEVHAEWDDSIPYWCENLKIYNASDPDYSEITYGDTVYVNDKQFLFEYSLNLDPDWGGDDSDYKLKFSCESDVADAEDGGIIVFKDNGTATINIYTYYDVLVSSFKVVYRSLDSGL